MGSGGRKKGMSLRSRLGRSGTVGWLSKKGRQGADKKVRWGGCRKENKKQVRYVRDWGLGGIECRQKDRQEGWVGFGG